MNLTVLGIVLYASAYVMLFTTWVSVVFLKIPGADNLVSYIIGALGALTGHILTMINPSRDASMRPAPAANSTPLPPIISNQAGFISIAMMGTLVLCAISLFCISGCSSLQYAGNASYSVKPFVTDAKTGATACCEVTIQDGKERASMDVHVVKTGDNYDITLSEKGVLAFQGQQIAAGATKDAIDAAAKAAVAAALAPVLPVLIPAVGAVLSSGTTGAVVGGAAIGVAADKALTPAAPK